MALSRTSSLTNSTKYRPKIKRTEVSFYMLRELYSPKWLKLLKCSFLSECHTISDFNEFVCFHTKKKLKPKRANGDEYKFRSSRIVEVDNENDGTASEKMGAINNLDLKYELFCKWLQQNEQNPIPNDDRDQPSSTTILTEDEVSSFATNSDDSGSDIFLDTETDFPVIVLTYDDNELHKQSANDLNSTGKLNGVDSLSEFRVETPSQLSVSDFDCSSSDITVNSKISAESGSSGQAKRKAKHKKGRAPPVPAVNTKINGSDEFDHTASDKSTRYNVTDELLTHPAEFPSITRSRETDI